MSCTYDPVRRGARLAAIGCSILLMLSACGGGGLGGAGGSGGLAGSGGSESTCSTGCGTVMTTLTDAPGDFLSYVVTLTSLALTKPDGTVVQTLPAATTVDFAQLVDLSEIVDAGQIPAGVYTGVQVTIDYANAQITADNGSGTAVTLTPVDASGNALTGTEVLSVQLDDAHQLVVTPADTSRLALDFNLAASNLVDLSNDTVQVMPTLVATVAPSDTTTLRVRGVFASASSAQNDFVLDIEPFFTQTTGAGQVTVQVSTTTTYQVNGTAYSGAAGFAALAALAAGTPVAALGSLQTGTNPWTFTASSILAGTSLQSPTQDAIEGIVIARSQNTLTVRGATWIRPGGLYGGFLPHDVPVTLGTGTDVTEEGATGSYTIADISVGQYIEAFGTATQASGSLTSLDASAGQVQLDITPLTGMVTSLAAGTLGLNVQSIDGLGIGAFDFAGTGSATANDANPAAYLVATGTLSQSGLAVGQPARVFGFPTAFGAAPPDFTATTLVSYPSLTSTLLVDWGRDGSTTAISGLTASSTSLQLNLTGVGSLHAIQEGPLSVDLTTLAGVPPLVPAAASATQVFSIGHAGRLRTENFNSFAAFVTQLDSELTGTTAVIVVSARGTYDSTANTFTATAITVVLSM